MGYEVIVNAQIIDPKNYIVQSCLTINDSIKSELKIELRDVFSSLRSEDVMLQLPVLEKEIAAKMNNAMENIGIKIGRVNFTSISFANNEKKIANLSDYVL